MFITGASILERRARTLRFLAFIPSSHRVFPFRRHFNSSSRCRLHLPFTSSCTPCSVNILSQTIKFKKPKTNIDRSLSSSSQMSTLSLADEMPTAEEVAMKRKATKIISKLNEIYPTPPESFLDNSSPFTLLVAVLLSAQTTDERVNQVTPELFKEAPTATAMASLPKSRIATLIKSVGLAPRKATYLSQLSAALVKNHDGEVPNDMASLEALSGVGHKTASVVIMQAFGKPAFPVDTHIHRLACRWGCGDGKSVVRTEGTLKTWFADPESWRNLHVRMILFGREHCKATRHDMDECPICKFAATEEAREANQKYQKKFVAAEGHRNPYFIRNEVEDGGDVDEEDEEDEEGEEDEEDEEDEEEEDDDNNKNVNVNDDGDSDVEIEADVPVGDDKDKEEGKSRKTMKSGRGKKKKILAASVSEPENEKKVEGDDVLTLNGQVPTTDLETNGSDKDMEEGESCKPNKSGRGKKKKILAAPVSEPSDEKDVDGDYELTLNGQVPTIDLETDGKKEGEGQGEEQGKEADVVKKGLGEVDIHGNKEKGKQEEDVKDEVRPVMEKKRSKGRGKKKNTESLVIPLGEDINDDAHLEKDNKDDAPLEEGNTPLKKDNKGGTHLKKDNEGGTPLKIDNKGDTPLKKDIKGDTPLKKDIKGDTPLKKDSKGDTPRKKDKKGDTEENIEDLIENNVDVVQDVVEALLPSVSDASVSPAVSPEKKKKKSGRKGIKKKSVVSVEEDGEMEVVPSEGDVDKVKVAASIGDDDGDESGAESDEWTVTKTKKKSSVRAKGKAKKKKEMNVEKVEKIKKTGAGGRKGRKKKVESPVAMDEIENVDDVDDVDDVEDGEEVEVEEIKVGKKYKAGRGRKVIVDEDDEIVPNGKAASGGNEDSVEPGTDIEVIILGDEVMEEAGEEAGGGSEGENDESRVEDNEDAADMKIPQPDEDKGKKSSVTKGVKRGRKAKVAAAGRNGKTANGKEPAVKKRRGRPPKKGGSDMEATGGGGGSSSGNLNEGDVPGRRSARLKSSG